MTNLSSRLDKLENRFGLDDAPIFFRLEPRDWTRISMNKNIPVIYLHPDKNDHDRVERLSDIARLKEAGNLLILISQSDGGAIWEDGKCINDNGLGHE